MTRSWKDVKADKARRDVNSGRDVGQAREDARRRTRALILDFRLTHPSEPRELP